MKTQEITIQKIQGDPGIDALIKEREKELRELSHLTALRFSVTNQPGLVGDKIENYTSEIKASCEKLAADVLQIIQPGPNFPEARMDADYYRDQETAIDAEIDKLENENRNRKFDLQGFDNKSIPLRIRWVIIISIFLIIGEVLFNTKAFQIVGESFLFAFLISLCISIAVSVFSHIVPMWMKWVKEKAKKWLIAIGSLVLAGSLFAVLSGFRSEYLAAHDVHVNPINFILINLFLFSISALFSYFLLPPWQEIKQHLLRKKIQQELAKVNKKMEQLNMQKQELKRRMLESAKQKIKLIYYSNYVTDGIRKLYWQCMGIFKTVNLANRSDHKVPDCWDEFQEAPDITEIPLNLSAGRGKQS